MKQCASKILILAVGLFLITFALTSCSSKAQEDSPSAFDSSELIEVKFHNLTVDPRNRQPVVMLADLAEERAFLIWIGIVEARAIHAEMQGVEPVRPLTHDLLENVIQITDGNIERIIITRVEESVFYATILIKQNGSVKEIDARPSDSIVMALKFKSPIFVSRQLFDEMAVSVAGQKEIEETYGITVQELSAELAKYLSFEPGKGVLVSDVRAGSPAEKDGVKTGDIVVEIGNEAVENVISMRNALVKNKSAVEAKIYRKELYLSITLHLKAP
jgi:bifunctional DNase/RNase